MWVLIAQVPGHCILVSFVAHKRGSLVGSVSTSYAGEHEINPPV